MTAIFAALSDPTRLAVVERLVAGPASVSELSQPFDMAVPSFLKHLKVLEESGLVKSVIKNSLRGFHISAGKNRSDQCSAVESMGGVGFAEGGWN